MKKTIIRNLKDEISIYSNAQSKKHSKICDILKIEIDKILGKASSKIYYAMPVWFIEENPIVGYNATPKYVNLLFWSGQGFKEPGLISEGKFKAAQIKFTDPTDINLKSLRRWLRESKTVIFDYKNLRKNNGRLDRMK
jgi:hypothetical protein